MRLLLNILSESFDLDPSDENIGITRHLCCSQGVGHYYPRMPCLRCGCPWWLGEDWDARCARCGWDCEEEGYDDDSHPLPALKSTWQRFTASVRRGKTPPWEGECIENKCDACH